MLTGNIAMRPKLASGVYYVMSLELFVRSFHFSFRWESERNTQAGASKWWTNMCTNKPNYRINENIFPSSFSHDRFSCLCWCHFVMWSQIKTAADISESMLCTKWNASSSSSFELWVHATNSFFVVRGKPKIVLLPPMHVLQMHIIFCWYLCEIINGEIVKNMRSRT